MGRTTSDGRCRQTIEYAPLPSQARFHRSRARFKGFSGSIGSGKSQALCQEAIRLSYLNPGRTGLIGAPTYPMLRDATLAALSEILAHNQIPYELRNRYSFDQGDRYYYDQGYLYQVDPKTMLIQQVISALLR